MTIEIRVTIQIAEAIRKARERREAKRIMRPSVASADRGSAFDTPGNDRPGDREGARGGQ
jgi:hypothetical protein